MLGCQVYPLGCIETKLPGLPIGLYWESIKLPGLPIGLHWEGTELPGLSIGLYWENAMLPGLPVGVYRGCWAARSTHWVVLKLNCQVYPLGCIETKLPGLPIELHWEDTQLPGLPGGVY